MSRMDNAEYANMPSLVKVRSFLGVAEAELARIRLAMDGIPACLGNAEMVSWAWYYSNAIGGVKLFVNEPDHSRAAIILAPQPVPEQFQPSRWHCPKCQADMDGLWSFCWSCGTSKQGEEDPDFHAWYRESGGSLSRKSDMEVIAAIISLISVAAFLAFNNSPVVLFLWLVALMLWVPIARLLSLNKSPIFNADFDQEPEHSSPTNYDPALDEFNPADDIAYKLWKAAVFSIHSFILFLFAIGLWFKTQQVVTLLSQKGCRRYYYASLFIVFNIMFYGWIVTWLFKYSLFSLIYRFLTR
jgi:hypothetical protein